MMKSQFCYCHLVWMFCSRQSNNLINKIQECSRRISYKNQKTSYQTLLEIHTFEDSSEFEMNAAMVSLTFEIL